MVARPEPGSIPDAPGSYQFLDGEGRVIYVGKAKSLRSRLSNYFAAPETLLPRTRQMVAVARTVEWIEVRNEVEALFLDTTSSSSTSRGSTSGSRTTSRTRISR
jgi:excinuclease ABC subunit C